MTAELPSPELDALEHRLRDLDDLFTYTRPNVCLTVRDAADAIRALRADRDKWKAEAEARRERKIRCEELEKQNDDLRAALARAEQERDELDVYNDELLTRTELAEAAAKRAEQDKIDLLNEACNQKNRAIAAEQERDALRAALAVAIARDEEAQVKLQECEAALACADAEIERVGGNPRHLMPEEQQAMNRVLFRSAKVITRAESVPTSEEVERMAKMVESIQTKFDGRFTGVADLIRQQAREIARLQASIEVANSAAQAAVGKARWQAVTNSELNESSARAVAAERVSKSARVEVVRLRAELERAERERDDAIRAQASLRLEIESMRSSDWYKDAERYRWLRDPPEGAHEWLSVCSQDEAVFGEHLDAAIDAALAALEESQ